MLVAVLVVVEARRRFVVEMSVVGGNNCGPR